MVDSVRPRIVFVTPILENPPSGGPTIRIINSIKALNIISDLHVISRASHNILNRIRLLIRMPSFCLKYSQVPSLGIARGMITTTLNILSLLAITNHLRIINKYRDLVRKSIKKVDLFYWKKDIDYIVNYVKENRIDYIWFGFGNISYNIMVELKEKLPLTKMICDTDSVWSRFVLRELDENAGLDIASKEDIRTRGEAKQKEEQSWVNLVEVTTAVSDLDAEYYRSIAKNKNCVKVFSNVIDFDMYNLSRKKIGCWQHLSPSIGVTGSFGRGSAMEYATRWLINDVMPFVWEKLPKLHLFIVGKKSEISFAQINAPQITVTGKVPSVLPYLYHVDVAVVPLKWESGTRFKILEAAICGVPVVSTTLGAEGLTLVDGKDIIIADSPIDFANGILRLIQEREFAKNMAKSCKKIIEEKYGIDVLLKEGKEIIEYLETSDILGC